MSVDAHRARERTAAEQVRADRLEAIAPARRRLAAPRFLVPRLVQILVVGVRYLAAVAFNTVRGRLTRDEPAEIRLKNARELRLALQRLAGTFIKFGQIMAMRPDFLPQEYIDELVRLLDEVPPFPTPKAVVIIERELGRPVDAVFSSFPRRPIASASFGQVYRAELASGELVAVKVQRPSIERVVAADLKILGLIARVVDATTILMTIKLRPIYEDFRRWTAEELDYRVEARYAARLRENGAAYDDEIIPRVVPECTTKRVLTLEFLDGRWMNHILIALTRERETETRRLLAEGIDVEEVARCLIRIMLRQVFVGGLFHGNPHAANIVVLDGNRVGLVDFGIVGVMIDEFQRDMLTFLERVAEGSPSRAFEAALRILELPPGIDLRAFRNEYQNNLQNWMSAARDPQASLAEKSNARLLLGNLDLMRRYRVRLPATVLRYYRAFIIVDSIILQLAPSVNMVDEIRAFFAARRRESTLAKLTAENYLNAFLGYQLLLLEAPRVLSEIADLRLRAEAELREAGRDFRRLGAGALRGVGVFAILAAVLIVVLRVVAGVTTYPAPGAISIWEILAGILALLGLGARWLARRILAL